MQTLATHWWMVGLRGACSVLFGLALILWPGMTLVWLILLFGCYALADGILALLFGIAAALRGQTWKALVLEGVFNLALAGLMLIYPGLTIVFAISLVGCWAILSGATLLAAARRFDIARWLVILAATVSILLGALLLVAPIQGAVVMAIWLGIYALLFGLSLLGVAWHFRGIHRARILL